MALDDVLTYLADYDAESFEVVSFPDVAPAESDVERFERLIGFRLPEDFREFLMSPLNGLRMAVREEHWPRPECFHVGTEWTSAYGFKVFTLAPGVPADVDLRKQYQEPSDAGSSDLVPFLQRESEEVRYCFDPSGRIFEWETERPGRRREVFSTFSELMMEEIRELEYRCDRVLRAVSR